MIELVKQNFNIIQCSDPDAILEFLERCGRKCYKSEAKITSGSAKKFLSRILTNKEHPVIEHCIVSVDIRTNRGVSHELVRHRLASYMQESTRFCNYAGKDIMIIRPPKVNLPLGFYDCARVREMELSGTIDVKSSVWIHSILSSVYAYVQLLDKMSTYQLEEWKPEDARDVLPNALKTEIIMTCNLREWRHVFTERTSKKAHPQMRNLMRAMLYDFKQRIPIIFDDIVY